MMKIELKKVSFNERLSDETNCYSAQVWVNGVHICDAMNHGHGGPDEHHPAKGKTMRDVDALDKAIKKERGTEKFQGIEIDIDLEIVCGELLNDHFFARDLRRSLKSKVLFEKNGQLLGVKFPKGLLVLGAFIEKVKAYHGVTTLNEMPFDNALAVFKKHNS